MSRIVLADDNVSAVMKMVDGNPGATTVCTSIISRGASIDPDGFMGGLGIILWMDTLEIYGSRIWILFKDVCKKDLVKMLGVLRAVQLGFLDITEFNFAIDNRGKGIDVDDLLIQVRERLPRFGQS